MAVKSRQARRTEAREPLAISGAALEALAAASRALAVSQTLSEALDVLAGAAANAAGADVALVRVIDADGQLRARAVWAFSSAVAAELEGSRFPASELPLEEAADEDAVPEAVRRAAARAGARVLLQIPIVLARRPVASLELMRARRSFSAGERLAARLVAYQTGLAVRALGEGGQGAGRQENGAEWLERVGDALSAGSDHERTAESVTRLAAEAADARAALLWRNGDAGTLALAAVFGADAGAPELSEAAATAARALAEARPVAVEQPAGDLPGGPGLSVTFRLGEPAVGGLQLLFPPGSPPSPEALIRLTTFCVRAAHALRASERAAEVEAELGQTRALLAVLGQAIAQLSLTHTLETAVQRVAELLDADRLAVYLLDEEGRLLAAEGRGLAGPHAQVAERLLELALGPFRGRGVLVLDQTAAEPRLSGVEQALAEAGIEAAIAVPLLVHDEVIGLLAVYPPAGRVLGPGESTLLAALAAQLAVAVQNARLHERAKTLGAERERALAAERHAARRLGALYEISRSFTESLSLEETLDAVARAVVELLGVDAAVIRMPDERREHLVPRAVHVADARVTEPVRALLSRPQELATLPGRRNFRMGRPLVLDAETAESVGASYELLVPFLKKGSSVAVVPVATQTEVLATMTLLSLDSSRPIDSDTIDAALALAGQAALALDNARLYQQQKDFADTMQRSLLPRAAPALEGLEVGDVYASSARMEVGGDVYDYLALEDGTLTVVVGDVTGHGIDATADMAMAKFVFRSLARQHPEPADFLAAANEIVLGEVGAGKFITMIYLTVDPARGEVACATAGHPSARLVAPDGTVSALGAQGLALGIEAGQGYEEVRAQLEPGAAVVLYTDGVLEARRSGELFGLERLDDVLARRREAPAQAIAEAVLDECRAFAGGELVDDCAVVVIKKVP